MADPYHRHLPPPDVAIELSPEQLALFVLRFLNDPDTSDYRNRYNFTLMSNTDYAPNPGRAAMQIVLAEAWAWLEREGLIVPRPGVTGDWFEVTRRGKRLQSDADFEAYKRGNLLRREALNPSLEQKVWPLFIGGQYDVAAFQALKFVEIRVRQLGCYSEADYGVDMVNRAFKPGGPLSDPGQQPAEQEAIHSLFAGAIGALKNPGSHRVVPWEPAAAAEAVFLANLLLRIFDGVESRLKGGG
jgi:uncharacterized protein (TIGR02391 family)